jgi:hypothetical protein
MQQFVAAPATWLRPALIRYRIFWKLAEGQSNHCHLIPLPLYGRAARSKSGTALKSTAFDPKSLGGTAVSRSRILWSGLTGPFSMHQASLTTPLDLG